MNEDNFKDKNKQERKDKIQIMKLLALFVVSFCIGFGLVLFLISSAGDSESQSSVSHDKKKEVPLTDINKPALKENNKPETLPKKRYAPPGIKKQTFIEKKSSKSVKTDGEASKGKTVSVLKDKVNVRESPVNGKSFGKISSGNTVQLLGKKSNWCHIITPNGNNGWIICSALDIP